MKTRILGIAGLTAVLLGASVVAQRLTAEQVLDKAEAAAGGAKIRTLKSIHVKGIFQAPAQKLSGTIEIYFKAPNKVLVRQTIPGVLEQTSGFDGKVGWEKSNMTGLREIKGKELEQLKSAANFTSVGNWRKQYRNPRLRGVQKLGNHEVYVIDLTTTHGTKATLYIDTREFLVRRDDSEVVTPQGSIVATSLLEDYRRVDGIMYPFRVRQQVSGMESVIYLQQVRHNVPINDSLFRKPKQ